MSSYQRILRKPFHWISHRLDSSSSIESLNKVCRPLFYIEGRGWIGFESQIHRRSCCIGFHRHLARIHCRRPCASQYNSSYLESTLFSPFEIDNRQQRLCLLSESQSSMQYRHHPANFHLGLHDSIALLGGIPILEASLFPVTPAKTEETTPPIPPFVVVAVAVAPPL